MIIRRRYIRRESKTRSRENRQYRERVKVWKVGKRCADFRRQIAQILQDHELRQPRQLRDVGQAQVLPPGRAQNGSRGSESCAHSRTLSYSAR